MARHPITLENLETGQRVKAIRIEQNPADIGHKALDGLKSTMQDKYCLANGDHLYGPRKSDRVLFNDDGEYKIV